LEIPSDNRIRYMPRCVQHGTNFVDNRRSLPDSGHGVWFNFSKEVVLEIDVEKTKHILLSHHQNAGQNWDIKIANKLFENVSQFEYL
jgi:hypothetical protein